MNDKRVERAIQKGMSFIAAQQEVDGSFLSYSSPTLSTFKPNITYRTVFAPALILGALSQVQNPTAKLVCDKLVAWLFKQRGADWSFNYWATTAPEREHLPYPDDLDDTFCALIGLRKYNPALIDDACLGKVVRLLIATEIKPGGPYRTWLAQSSAPKWNDVDLAVNCNIAYFLRLVAEPLPNLTALMEKAIQTQSPMSPYYPSVYPVAYFLARAYDGPLQAKLARYLLQKRQDNTHWGNPLNTSLALSSLLRLGVSANDCYPAAQYLITEQRRDGSWDAAAFCNDPAIQNKKYYNGSAAMTTAFALQALSLLRSQKAQAIQTVQAPKAKKENELHARITTLALDEVKNLSPELRRRSLAAISQMSKGDTDHSIILLPHIFNKSLKKPATRKSHPLMHLGLANLYGWIAYTIYDDCMDEGGSSELLPVANTALRYSVYHFDQAMPNQLFQKLVAETFNSIDGANSWELAHCRMAVTKKTITLGNIPDFKKTLRLADRSVGHILAPMGVLLVAGVPTADPRAILVRRALRHYLVARQLNDDLHDWEEDFRSGLITYVVAAILRDLNIPPGTYVFSKLIPRMQRQFWHHTLLDVCKTITNHTAHARRAAKASSLLTEPNIITELADKMDASVERTLHEQSNAEAFLASYRGANSASSEAKQL